MAIPPDLLIVRITPLTLGGRINIMTKPGELLTVADIRARAELLMQDLGHAERAFEMYYCPYLEKDGKRRPYTTNRTLLTTDEDLIKALAIHKQQPAVSETPERSYSGWQNFEVLLKTD